MLLPGRAKSDGFPIFCGGVFETSRAGPEPKLDRARFIAGEGKVS